MITTSTRDTLLDLDPELRPVVADVSVRARLGREAHRRARKLAEASGRVAAPGPDLTRNERDVA